MKKLSEIFLAFFLVVFLSVAPVLAADFALTAISSLDTSGGVYSQMWYTGNQPTFTGTGTAGNTVAITLDDSEYSATVDSSGNWNWTPPAALADGDHTVSLVSGSETISFTLTTGSSGSAGTSTESGTGTSSALPTTGIFGPTLAVLGVAGLMMLTPALRKAFLKRES